MKNFWDMAKSSALAQGTVTVALVGTCCYLWGSGQVVPDNLWTALTIVLGFFFGAKVTQKLGK